MPFGGSSGFGSSPIIVNSEAKMNELGFSLALYKACNELNLQYLKENVSPERKGKELIYEANRLAGFLFDEGLKVSKVIDEIDIISQRKH